jgi:hypothetical protein
MQYWLQWPVSASQWKTLNRDVVEYIFHNSTGYNRLKDSWTYFRTTGIGTVHLSSVTKE